MPTQKTNYKALRRFTITTTKNGEREIISIEAGETYKSADYYEKGKFIPKKYLQLLIENKVIE